MKSKASFKSHPIHPILVSFPIAFLIGTFVFDILFILTKTQSFWQTAYYLEIAGIATGLLAAIPGFIDYLFTIPPESSAKKRGAKHAIANVSHLILFFIALMMKINETSNITVILILEAVGVVLIFIAGYLGGTLIYRNQIGVDGRYANAGKWKEAYKPQTGHPVKVASADELEINQMKLIHIGKKRIVIGKNEKGYVAFDDRCPHKGGSLAGGAMICGTVQCPWHGSQFDVSSGVIKAGPAKEGIKTYTLTEKEGDIFLKA